MREIKRDINGFIEDSVLEDMRNSLPIRIKELDSYGNPNYVVVNNSNELEDYLFSPFGNGKLVGYEPVR